MEITSDLTLSYSSANLLVNCEKRYWHYKVNKTPNDPDYEETYTAINVGKAFHHVLEHTKHTGKDLGKYLKEACEKYEVQDDMALLHAMLLRYLEIHKDSGLTCFFTEIEIKTPTFLGFVDVGFKDEEGNWFIADLKTAARIDNHLKPKLIKDTQLNLYAGFKEHIAEQYNLNPEKFKGVRYRVTSKPSLKRQKSESYVDYVARLKDRVESLDIFIPVELLKPKEVYEEHKRLQKRSVALKKGTVKPTCNYTYCFSYFRPCPYYSHCYGMTVTEANERLI